MNKFWNWKFFVQILLYYACVFVLFVLMQSISVISYFILVPITASLCTFINSDGVEEFINNVFYGFNDLMFASMNLK